MDEMANVSSRRRRVRCPTCQHGLVEPPGCPPIYQCPFCCSYLRAKGVPPDFRGESWQMPMNEDNQGTENGQQTTEQESLSVDVSELTRSQNQGDDHEIKEPAKGVPPDFQRSWQMPMNEDNQGVENGQHTNDQEFVSIDGSESIGSQNQLDDHEISEPAKGVPPDFQRESWQMPMSEDNQGIENGQHAIEQGFVFIDGSEFVGSQNQLDDHEINERVSIDGDARQQEQLPTENGSVVENKREQERQLDLVVAPQYSAKGVPQGESWQKPMNEDNQGIEKGQQTNEQKSMSPDGSELIGLHKEQLSTENGSVVEKREQELQLEDDCGNTLTSAGDNDLLAEYASKNSTTNTEEAMAVDCEERDGTLVSNSGASPEAHLLLDHTIPPLLLKDAETCSMPSSSEETNKFVGEHEDDTVGEGVEQIFQSEIIRDNELSFKYISSALESNDQLAPRKRTSRCSKLSSEGSGLSSEGSGLSSEMPSEQLNMQLTERPRLSSEENSDDYEIYSSASESISHESLDSEFDFPSPSAQSLQPSDLSDSLFQPQMPLPEVHSDALPNPHGSEIALPNSNGALPTPHQLEWQDVDQKSGEGISFLQTSNAAVTSSSEVDFVAAFDVPNAVDQGDQEERAESEKGLSERHLQKDIEDERDQKHVVDQRDQKAEVVVREKFFQVQGESTGLVGGLASVVEYFSSIESNNSETEEGSNGFLESVAHQLNEHRALLNNGLQAASGPLDLLSSGAEHPSRLQSGATLKEGIATARILISDTEAPSCSLSDGSELANSLATHENINLVQSVANLKLEDAAATIASKTAVLTSGASQSSISSQMIRVEKIQDGSSDPLHPLHNMLLSDVNNQSWVASTSGDVPTKREVKGANAVHNLEPEPMCVQPISFENEQGYSSSHSGESQLYYGRDYSSEGVQGVYRAAEVNMFDSIPHHRRIYSEETRAQSERAYKYTPQAQKNMHNEGPPVPRSKRIPAGSSRMHQRHPEAAFELADGQGQWQQQKQNHQADMHMMQHNMNYSEPTNGFSRGNLQPFGSNYYAKGSDPFARGVPNASLALTYQAPPHSWMLPVMPGIHCGCHSAAPGYIACMHCQHSHLPQLPMPPCGLCYNQTLPPAHQQGHTGWYNPPQAHQVRGSGDLQASGVRFSSPGYPTQTARKHDAAIPRRKPGVSSASEPKHYPPLIRGNTAPYIICKRCDEVLEVPTDIPFSDTTVQKVRCGQCNKVAKFSVLDDSWATINAAQDLTATNQMSGSTSHVSNLHAVQYGEESRHPPVLDAVQSMDSSYPQGIINSGLHPPVKHVSTLHAVQYSEESRQPPGLDAVQSMDSFYPQGIINSGLHPQVKQGSFGSQQQISAASKRRGSLSVDELVQSPKYERDASDQDEFFFRSLSRYSEFDSSRIFFNGFKASSSAVEASNFDGMLGGDVMHVQTPVDEKEEGLDFGAPRMSDGESLGHRSPESRMRSPENMQHFQQLDLSRHAKGSPKDVEDAASASKRRMIAEGKRPTRSLYALLNQESSKFDISSFDDARTVWFSTASNSPMDDEYASERYDAVGYGMLQSSMAASNRSGRKGPMYVMGMLRRSLKNFSRGKQ